MKNYILLFATSVLLSLSFTSCTEAQINPQPQVSVIATGIAYIPLDNITATGINTTAYSDMGRDANAPSANNFANAAFDAVPDRYLNSSGSFMKDIVMSLDNGNGGIIKVVVDREWYIRVANGNRQGLIIETYNGKTCIKGHYVTYTRPCAYAGVDGTGFSLYGINYNTEVTFQ